MSVGPAYDLFAAPGWTLPSLEDALAEVALSLAARAGGAGVTAADVRLRAAHLGMLPPNPGTQRAWSFLAPLFRRLVAAGELVPTGRYRRSPIPKSHGNRHQVYVLPEYATHA